MEERKWKVQRSQEDSMMVDDDWLDSIPRDGIKSLMLWDSKKLRVTYECGSEVWYQDIHGTWGFPQTVE